MKVRPHPLGKVDLQRTEQPREKTDVDRGQQDIASRILDLFRQGGDPIEPNVGERRE